MALGREIQDFLGAWGKVESIQTSRAKRDYYANGGKRGGYNPNQPPPGWGGVGAMPSANPGLGRRITNAIGLSQPGGPSVGQQIGGAIGGGSGRAGTGGWAAGTGAQPVAVQDPYANDPDQGQYQETYAGGGEVEPPLVIPPLPEPTPDPGVPVPAPQYVPQDLMPPMASYPPQGRPQAVMSPRPVGPAVDRAPAAPAARKAMNDQTRTEAYDPTLDGPGAASQEEYGPPASAAPAVGGARASTPQSGDMTGNGAAGLSTNNASDDIGAALHGALTFAQKTFHLDGSNVGVGTDPHAAGGAKALFSGVGAAPAQLVQQLDQRVNANLPPGPNSDQLAVIRRIHALYTWRQANGDKQGADKAAFELVQYTAGVAAQLGDQAVQQFRAGDVAGASKTVQQAYNQIPDGRHLDVNGNTATVVDTRTGKPVQSFQFTQDQILNAALGLSNRSLYWQTLVRRVGEGGKASNRTESQQDLDHARADYYRARTGQVGKPKAGGGGRVAPGQSSDARAIVEQLKQIPHAPGSPGLAPPQVPQDNTPPQGGGEAPSNNDDDDEEPRVLNAPPDLKTPEAGTPESVLRVTPDASGMRLKPARAAAGTNPPTSSPAAGGAPAPAAPSSSPAVGVGGGGQPVEDPDYDMKGALAAGEKPDERGHMTDRYKRPNHPTFSDESIYSTDKERGGHWEELGGGKWAFTPGPANLKGGVDKLKKYLAENDPDVELRMPGSAVAGKTIGPVAKTPIDPDVVPALQVARDGENYVKAAGRGTPKPFEEPAPTGVPKELLDAQTAAVKFTAREGGPAVRQHIAQRIKEWNDYNKGYATRQKEWKQNETKRVEQEYKDLTTKQKADAKAEFDFSPKPGSREEERLQTDLKTAYDEKVGDGTDTKKTEALKGTVFADGTASKEAIQRLAMDLRTTNRRVDSARALEMIGNLTNVDPADPTARKYKPVARDVLGNVVLQTEKYGTVHMRPDAYGELVGIVKKRLGAAETAKTAPPEGKGIGAKALDTLKSAPAYVVGAPGPQGSMVKDSARAIGNATSVPFVAGTKLGKKLREQARDYDPNDKTRGPAFGQ